jgi:predicted Fe-Mo cluster-binding NifX family protein
MGALNKLQAAGIQVFACDQPTAKEAVAAFVAGTLRPMQPGNACAGHAPGQGHGHGRP